MAVGLRYRRSPFAQNACFDAPTAVSGHTILSHETMPNASQLMVDSKVARN